MPEQTHILANKPDAPITGFSVKGNISARILILGSIPGVISLKQTQYYAHPQNQFWEFMQLICHIDKKLPYKKRINQLTNLNIALWDVAKHCVRPGSLDAKIKTSTVVVNDFNQFFLHHKQIHSIFFNGKKSEDLYIKKVLPNLSSPAQQIERFCLPSTSPANASMSHAEKLLKWNSIKSALNR